ncbi:hypothetical protein D3C81_1923620 [compost metagenome]
MVAKQRGQALVVEQSHAGQHHHRAQRQAQLAEEFATQRLAADGQLPQQPAGQHAEDEDEQRHLDREQVAHFVDVGFRDVAQHVGVDQHAVLAHEVGHARAGEEQGDQHRLEQPAERQRRQDEVEH